ncbi:hypothetical protein [Bdellovibrio svalbardensis]|uniref:Uncharacterized protein n=1 Tax=Bdellovibrio svalbardensis TaxID=2972972 RepID=A0ABT6DG51_9BACT|nr:hypothetical protein [Bdellovibrio svalbardensis]MDG0815828.1 hypothetical protein [Bdellovibrio svalbardensis]
MAAIQCKLDIPNVEGLKDNELTVGREAFMTCEGEFPKNLNPQKLHFVETAEIKYLIKLLKANFESETKAVFVVTSYKAGDIRWPDLQMTDDSQTFSLGAIDYHVETVIPKPDPKQPQVPGQEQKTEAYGPIGPADIGIPHLYWVILLAAIGLIISLIVFKVVRVIQRRNMIERLKEHDSALAPLTQFHTSMRKLQRMNPAFFGGSASQEDIHSGMDELRHMLRLYITRKYQIPALEWSTRLIVKDIKKHHRKVYAECGNDLQALIKEYQHAFENKQAVIGSDIVNLAKRTRSLVELMESLS